LLLVVLMTLGRAFATMSAQLTQHWRAITPAATRSTGGLLLVLMTLIWASARASTQLTRTWRANPEPLRGLPVAACW
jgi:hypothetical protein